MADPQPCSDAPSLASILLYSITKHARKSSDGLDHRSLVQVVNDLHSSYPVEAVRNTFLELQDEGLLVQEEAPRKGFGWRAAGGGDGMTSQTHEHSSLKSYLPLSEVKNILSSDKKFRQLSRFERCDPTRITSQTVPYQGGRMLARGAPYQGCDLPGAPYQGGDLVGWSESSTAQSSVIEKNFLGTKLDKASEVTNLATIQGRYITRAKKRSPGPDSAFGLAAYFAECATEAGLGWGGTNRAALMKWFGAGRRAGVSAEEFRRIIDLFWLHPEAVRGSGRPAWVTFLAQREALFKQAQITSHRPPAVEGSHTQRNAAWLAERQSSMTLEDVDEAHRRRQAEVETWKAERRGAPLPDPSTPAEMRLADIDVVLEQYGVSVPR